jgi:protein gp37
LVDSLSELFHENLAQDAIDTVHAVMAVADWHGFIVLTRRAEEMHAYYADPRTPGRIAAHIERFAAMAHPPPGPSLRARGAARPAGPGGVLDTWPLPNLWLGVAVEDQDHAGRIGQLLNTPASLRWVCFEPLLGPVRPDLIAAGDDGYLDALAGVRFYLGERGRRGIAGEAPLRPLDWVVAGGEIGAAARPANPDWVRDLRDRCNAAGVPFFFKQWGEWAPAPEPGDPHRVVHSNRRTTGRLIDGRAWDETPARWRARPTRSW